MSFGKAKAVPSQDDESFELARFRAEWRAEVQNRIRAHEAEPQISSQGMDIGATTSSQPSAYLTPHILSTPSTNDSKSVLRPLQPIITSDEEVHGQRGPQALIDTLGAYNQAHRAGELLETLNLYGRVARMDDREGILSDDTTPQAEKEHMSLSTTRFTAPLVTQPLTPQDLDDMTASLRTFSIVPQTFRRGQVTGILGPLVAQFLKQEPDLNFEPQDETQLVAVNILPEEILVEIIYLLDPSSIESFAQVCRKARVLTLEPFIWRTLVLLTYKEPQMPDTETLTRIIVRNEFDYRRVYIEQPRVRMDGVYIAICHYIRPGYSENRWINTNHLITYHRYLRFYPNGQVLSLLANEDHPPQTIINVLKPSLRMKGLHIGTWSLSGTEILLENLSDASGRYQIPGIAQDPTPTNHSSQSISQSSVHHHQTHGSGDLRPPTYVFLMSLGLTSRPLGRWNRLEIHSYETLNLETGELAPVVLKHERPFWFSKVRSYV